mmetsp:Transcript_59884/g.177514  ORF Transcript_59884/g.177514 Transcript_59884/m.177514 type:complete len:614 (-) Transcript_59884:1123-2964(-)|eukprot:CAMPEP_0113597992 /NCGR_PEP_ID=MMETSP0015_2-20120614/41321_1 /TAXON_ID=2838 /ORGANISM="Odontella" /LENGTH=613 /DNA_ID=CAMNT_0000505923 /DNA_START=127 /DNA_END=1968 /DNA_ORIENTATION=- /assembly_acc=CAM_ASM_000160
MAPALCSCLPCVPSHGGGTTAGADVAATARTRGAVGKSAIKKSKGGKQQHVAFTPSTRGDDGGTAGHSSTHRSNESGDIQGSGVFHVTREGTDGEWVHGATDANGAFEGSDDGSVYMDAIDDFSTVAAYPPVIHDAVPPAPQDLDLDRPETLMKPLAEREADDLRESERAARALANKRGAKAMEHKAEKMLKSNKVMSMRRSTRALQKELTKPGVHVEERGFPGDLTEEEVENVQIFRRELEKRDPVYHEIVHGFHVVEEEAFALCRYLRARKFQPEQVFTLLDEGKDLWREAKKNDFYPNMEEAIGVNRSLFTSQYPFVYHGKARNGCPVAYLQCGGLQSEGVLCVTSMNKVPRYFWNSFMFDFIDQLQMCKEADKNFMRCECMQVYDLKGLSRAQVNQDAIDVIKMANQITTCFPETLHCLVIVNAPGFFSFAWKLIKKFIDPRTASKIEVYSSEKVQTKRLLELIDGEQLSSDYGGTGPSQHELLQRQARTTPESRGSLSELMQVKGSGETKFEFEVPAGEEINVTIHSRAKAGAHFSLSKESIMLKTTDVKPPGEGTGGGGKDNYVDPYRVEIAKNVRGPGTFHVTAKSLSKSPPGYYLFVGDLVEARQ